MIYTIGHGNRSTAEIVSLLREVGCSRLVDVRRYPGSRHNPHLSREALEMSLPHLGVEYLWRGENLGGRRKLGPEPSRHPAWREESFRAYADHMDTVEFRRGLAEIRAMAGAAIMCSETVWWRCHRRLIADGLVAGGTEVCHLLALGKCQMHELHPDARVEGGMPIYDKNCTLGLL